ncbi:MAG: GAF domain-containing protein, partial [bacterium]
FPGHIACDPHSRSEIVVPCFDIHKNIRAVLDLDSTEKDFFEEVDKEYLKKVTELTVNFWKTEYE